MANRRMFSKAVVDSDSFLEMPLSAQALYFHLGVRADDDGFVNNANVIRRMAGANEDDMKILAEKGYILTFESGIVAISHWKLHNYIQSDRYTPTVYRTEFSMLTTDGNKIYRLVSRMEAQDSIGEVRGEKERSEGGEVRAFGCASCACSAESPAPPPAPLACYGKFNHVRLTEEQYKKLADEYGKELIDIYIYKVDTYCQTNGKKYFDYEVVIREWIKEDGADNGIISGNTVTVRDSAYSTDI